MSIIVDDHESESGQKFLQALRILLTPPESYYGMILDCDIWTSGRGEPQENSSGALRELHENMSQYIPVAEGSH